jgi:hypothetical protein
MSAEFLRATQPAGGRLELELGADRMALGHLVSAAGTFRRSSSRSGARVLGRREGRALGREHRVREPPPAGYGGAGERAGRPGCAWRTQRRDRSGPGGANATPTSRRRSRGRSRRTARRLSRPRMTAGGHRGFTGSCPELVPKPGSDNPRGSRSDTRRDPHPQDASKGHDALRSMRWAAGSGCSFRLTGAVLRRLSRHRRAVAIHARQRLQFVQSGSPVGRSPREDVGSLR